MLLQQQIDQYEIRILKELEQNIKLEVREEEIKKLKTKVVGLTKEAK